MKKSLLIPLMLVLTVFFFLIGYSGYRLYGMMHEYKVSGQKFDDLSGQYVSNVTAPVSPAPDAPPVYHEFSPITVDFSQLREQNPDVVAWLYSPDTPINYPVVKGKDNNEYLYNFIDGTNTGSGTPFVDSMCVGDFSDQNTVIYAHHMKDGSMFASLSRYRSADYYAAHPCLYLNTPTQNYRIDLFSGYQTDAYSDTYIFDFSEEIDYLNFLSLMKAQSDFDSPVVPGAQDRIVTLSTCSYEYNDARYVVQGVLVPIG